MSEGLITLGRGSYVNPPYVTYGGNVQIGNYTSIASVCTFLCGPTANHPPALNDKAVSNFNFDAPPATLVLVERGERREARAAEPGTVVLAAGAPVSEAYRIAPLEYDARTARAARSATWPNSSGSPTRAVAGTANT